MSDLADLIEQLASTQHEIWSHWMEYLFSVSEHHSDGSVTIPADKVERWRVQMCTDYYELNDAEKESDREQAMKVLDALSGPDTTQ